MRHNTVPYNPQQNGVIERMKRTLLERVRCLLIESGLPKQFWGEALSTAAHIINKTPSTSLDLQIPDELWNQRKSKYDYLRVFGCLAYVHN